MCDASQFRCRSGICVASQKRCDGRYDCRDMTDEEGCGCSSGQFTCADGACIFLSEKGDGIMHCRDLSDKMDCGTYGQLDTTQPNQPDVPDFMCCDGNFISGFEQYDGFWQCIDGSDEFYCTAESKHDLVLNLTYFMLSFQVEPCPIN